MNTEIRNKVQINFACGKVGFKWLRMSIADIMQYYTIGQQVLWFNEMGLPETRIVDSFSVIDSDLIEV